MKALFPKEVVTYSLLNLLGACFAGVLIREKCGAVDGDSVELTAHDPSS